MKIGKFVLASLFCCAALTLRANVVRADTVTVGTLDEVGTQDLVNPLLFRDQQTFTNLMSDTNLDIATITTLFTDCNGGPGCGGTGPENETILPGQTLTLQESFLNGGPTSSIETIAFAGSIGASTFTVGGVQYQATDASWAIPAFTDEFNGIISIEINANPVNTPEPSSLLMLGSGLLGLMGMGLYKKTSGIGGEA